MSPTRLLQAPTSLTDWRDEPRELASWALSDMVIEHSRAEPLRSTISATHDVPP